MICGSVSAGHPTYFQIVEAKPHILKGTPALVGYLGRHPIGPQGRHRCHVGNFPEARPAFGEVPETL